MRACFYRRHGGPEVLEIGTLPDPVAGPGDVLVRLAAASVSPFDWKLRAGELAAFFTPALPKIPGRDGTGIVAACGAGVTDLAPGDPVAVMAPGPGAAGTHAERIALPRALVVPLPRALPLQDSAALVNAGLSATACARTAGVGPGMRVLVQGGAGAVGGMLVQLCRHLGAEVAATARAANRAHVEGLGAHRVLAHDAAAEALPPQDVVFDLVGGAVHLDSCRRLARGGHLVWLVAAPFADRSAEFGVRATRAMVTDDAAALAEVLALAAEGVLRPVVAGVLPLAQASEAQRRLAAGEVTRGRLLLAI
jgi:NADPH:quinone reductase-like Zn-dependent oxidoreductase